LGHRVHPSPRGTLDRCATSPHYRDARSGTQSRRGIRSGRATARRAPVTARVTDLVAPPGSEPRAELVAPCRARTVHRTSRVRRYELARRGGLADGDGGCPAGAATPRRLVSVGTMTTDEQASPTAWL